jgi:hypothetical protein
MLRLAGVVVGQLLFVIAIGTLAGGFAIGREASFLGGLVEVGGQRAAMELMPSSA